MIYHFILFYYYRHFRLRFREVVPLVCIFVSRVRTRVAERTKLEWARSPEIRSRAHASYVQGTTWLKFFLGFRAEAVEEHNKGDYIN